jgi:hypothetical protein
VIIVDRHFQDRAAQLPFVVAAVVGSRFVFFLSRSLFDVFRPTCQAVPITAKEALVKPRIPDVF